MLLCSNKGCDNISASIRTLDDPRLLGLFRPADVGKTVVTILDHHDDGISGCAMADASVVALLMAVSKGKDPSCCC